LDAITLLNVSICIIGLLLVGGTVIFLAIYFSPLISEYLYPWTRDQRVPNFTMSKGFISLNSFKYRVVFYKYNLEPQYFQRQWFLFSFASAAIYIVLILLWLILSPVICLPLFLLAGFILHIFLIRRTDSMFALKYELTHSDDENR